MRHLLSIISFFTILALVHQTAVANSCCGQSPASFPVLAMGQKINVTTGYTSIDSMGRIFDSNEFYQWTQKERRVQSYSLSAASTLAERHQLFVNSAFLSGEFQQEGTSSYSNHFSDTQVGYNYELLPEYSFSYWKPVVYVSALFNLPTGHSIYDGARLGEGADISGHNQWGAGLGLTFRKVYHPLTLTLQARSLQIFSKTFSDVQVSNFFDSSLAFLMSYALPWWNLQSNAGLTFSHLSERKIHPSDLTSGISQRWTLLAGLQRSLNASWVMGFNYSDQTLIGPAQNTLLNRSININFNYSYF